MSTRSIFGMWLLGSGQGYRAVLLLSVLFTLLSCLPAFARQVTIRVGDNFMSPSDVHVFAEDWVTFINESSGLTEIHFGGNCQYDQALDARYAKDAPWPAVLGPGEAETWIFPEPPGTVLHFLSSTRCRSAVATVTIHGRAESFKTFIPEGATVHSSELGDGKSLVFDNLAILGTLVLDGDTTLIVRGTGMPSAQLETFLLLGSIVCDLEPPTIPGRNGADGYDFTLKVNGAANMRGKIDLSGTAGAEGSPGPDAAGPVCSPRSYPSPNCTGSCTYYDDDRCKNGCDVCDPGWRLPEDCSKSSAEPCKCCFDQTYAAGRNGGNGGTGGKGGNGGRFKLTHVGELYGLPLVVSNGGAGGAGGSGGSGSDGCNESKCEVTRQAVPGRGGAPGAAGVGGNGGPITISTTGIVKDDYLPQRSAQAQADGGAGGAGGSAGHCPDWKKNPGFSSSSGATGGKGGKIALQAGCSTLSQSNLSACGGKGGKSPDQPYDSTLPGVAGIAGGSGGEITVQAGSLEYSSVMHAYGGDGATGGRCGINDDTGSTTGPSGGKGGKGGDGGTVRITAASNALDPKWVAVQGGNGGEGGPCGAYPGMAGTDGAPGAYTPETSSSQNARVALSADGSAAPGELLEYSIFVSARNAPLTHVTVSITLPATTIYVSASGKHTRDGNLVTWQLGNLESCQGETLTLRVRIDLACPIGTRIDCRATVASDGQPPGQSEPVQTKIESSSDEAIDIENLLGSGKNQILTAEPVNPATGNFLYSRELFSFPGKGLPIRFIATYNSMDNTTFGSMGAGWTHTFNVSLSLDSSSVVTIRWADGHKDAFQRGEGIYVPVRSYTDVVMSDTSSSGYQAALPDGTKYIFGLNGLLQRIEDRNSNAIVLEYQDTQDPFRLTRVTDTAGRAITFTYSKGLLSAVSGPLTRVLFAYSPTNDLVAITDGRGNTRRFTYDGEHRLLSTLDPMKRKVVTNTYDTFGRVIAQKNGLGQVTSYAYKTTSEGRQTTVTSPGGHAVVHHFDRNYNLVRVVDGEGCEAAFEYNGSGKCTTATDKMGASLTKTFDTSGNPLELTDRLGNTTQVEYDAINKATSIKDPLGNLTTALYDGKGNRLAITDPLDHSTQFTVNSAGQTTQMAHPSGLTLSTGYDGAGLPTSVSSSLGAMTSLTYDAAGRITALAAEDGSIRIEIAYDANGNPVAVTDPMGFETTLAYDANDNLIERKFLPLKTGFTYQYDVLNRLTKIVDPGKGETSYTYDPDGNVVSVTDPDGIATRFEYDKRNRLTAVHHPGGGTTTYGYDSNGNRTSVTDPFGRVWAFVYDAENHITKIVDPAKKTVTQTFDALGRLTARTDELGRMTEAEFDPAGRLTSKILPDGSSLRYGYDASGNRTQATDELGRFWSFAYDEAQRMVQATDPGGADTRREFDTLGRLVRRIDRSGAAVSYTYDADSRIVRTTLPDATTIRYRYDAAGRVLSAEGPSGKISRTYDAMGRTLSLTDSKGRTLRYGYTKAGRIASVTYPGGHKVTYGYDVGGRLSTVKDWMGFRTVYHYDTLNRVVAIDLPNGTRTVRTYDTNSRLSALKHVDSHNKLITGCTFTYDAAGQIGSAKRTEAVPTKIAASKRQFKVSASNRLTTGTLDGRAARFAFDENGSLVSKNVGGNLTTYGYDALNRLVSVQGPSGTTLYEYDALGDRCARTQSGVEVRTLSNGNTPFFHYSPSGAGGTAFVYGGALLYSLDEAGSLFVYHTDERGSVTAVTDGGENIVQALSYDPYGKILSRAGSLDNAFGFLGTHGVQTDENGLCFMKARYYDPELMRFVAEDPVGPEAALNLYAYAGGNPINRMDPSGLEDQDALGQPGADSKASQAPTPPDLPTWVAPFDVVISLIGITLTPAQQQLLKRALRNFDVVHDRTTDIVYLIPKDLTKFKSPIPLGKLETLGTKAMGYTGKLFTGLDIGINVYNGAKTTYNYQVEHGAKNFIKGLSTGDEDAWMVIHENAMGVNSTVLGRSKNPVIVIISAELTLTDYLVDNYVVDIIKKEYSMEAESEYLESQARLEGKLRGLQMRQEFEEELATMEADLKDLTESFHGSNYNDGLNGCSVQ